MRIIIFSMLALSLVISIGAREEIKILECLYEDDSLACAKKIADMALDEIELKTVGKNNSDVTISKVIEESGRFFVDGVHDMIYNNEEDNYTHQLENDNPSGNRNLIINIARFWLDLKKSHAPERVVYYEHAQHQHHYEPEDEHGYWKRRSLDNNNMPYSGWSSLIE
ncbi:hypothetical protein PV327_009116 [Microctonus hyperodae]|uniref:Uncharacterized protein n=1 Tax=Microctonus hyperodae TaxID=165561 RepID=A0AA39KVM9_MICHY|nr:hypothetical protein PV327_009116 [Microctonus hyperodae]